MSDFKRGFWTGFFVHGSIILAFVTIMRVVLK